MIVVASTIALFILGIAALLLMIRLLTTRTLADRMIALDALLLTVVAGIAVQAARTGSHTYFDVMVVTALLAFVGTALTARYISKRGN